MQSGIRTIPLVIALVIASITAGQLTGKIGYYTPAMYVSAVIMPIGAGLIYTFSVDTSEGHWIGYQILLGFGIGFGMQSGSFSAQSVLPKKAVEGGFARE